MTRIRTIQIAFGIGFVVILGRAARVQLVEGREHEAVARAARTRAVKLPAPRGGIFDRHGSPLALTEDVYRVDATRAEFRDTIAAIEALATNLGLARRTVERELRNRYSYFHGPFTTQQVAPLRNITGIHLRAEARRFSPNRSLARAILGSPARDGIPAGGLERVFDTLLVGTPGDAVVLRDQFNREYVSPGRLGAFPVPGHDVYLTIDADMQDLVEQALTEAIERYRAVGGDVIIMRARTGEVLAVASRTDRGTWSSGAFTSVFQPGSTAKLFAASALLANDLVRESDSVFGEGGEWTVGSRTIHDEHDEGWLRLPDVIRRSSNIGMAKFVERLSAEQQFRMLRRFGLGTPTGVEFSSEAEGLLYLPDRWSRTSAASLAMGYEVAVTMIQLAQAYAAVANDGVMMRPTLLHSVYAPDGQQVYRHRPEPVRRVLDEELAAELRAMLRRVVDSGGTAEPALMSIEVAGKTGTSRRVVNGRYLPGSYMASFVAVVPADDPELVIAVKLDDPEDVYSAATAVPFTRMMLEQLHAGESPAIRRERFGTGSDAPAPRPTTGAGSVPYVTDWPTFAPGGPAAPRPIPDVVDLSLRDALRRLHQLGVHVKVVGWGTIDSVVPAAGTLVKPGSVVTVHGTERRAGR